MTAFLGVEASATGRRWIGPTIEADRLAEAMVQETRLPPAVARVLVARGVAPDDAARFLDPHLRDLLPDIAVIGGAMDQQHGWASGRACCIEGKGVAKPACYGKFHGLFLFGEIRRGCRVPACVQAG